MRRSPGQLSAAKGDLGQLQNERDRLAAELAAARQQLGDGDRSAAEFGAARQRIADLEGQLGQSKSSLSQAERDLVKALRPEISKGRCRSIKPVMR